MICLNLINNNENKYLHQKLGVIKRALEVSIGEQLSQGMCKKSDLRRYRFHGPSRNDGWQLEGGNIPTPSSQLEAGALTELHHYHKMQRLVEKIEGQIKK